jgi:stress response protein YsnF
MTIIPLVEEVLVVEKRLLLREEIRVTRRQSAEKFHEVYTLQSEEVHVERDGDINPL